MVAPAGASSTSRLQVVTSSHCWLTSPRAASLHSTSYTAEERWDSCNHTDDHQHRTAAKLSLPLSVFPHLLLVAATEAAQVQRGVVRGVPVRLGGPILNTLAGSRITVG